jgi:hypothetical protein
MTITYEEYTSLSGKNFVRRNNEDGTVSDIPMDEANSDYQAYLNKDTLPSNSSIPQAGA